MRERENREREYRERESIERESIEREYREREPYPPSCARSSFLPLHTAAPPYLTPFRSVFQGTYSGLCYHTDGKSHQSFTDMSVLSGLPGLLCIDPVTQRQAEALANWVAQGHLPVGTGMGPRAINK